MSIANPIETFISILADLDRVRSKMDGTPLAAFPWRPASPSGTDDLAELSHEVMERCENFTEAVIVVTIAAVVVATLEARRQF